MASIVTQRQTVLEQWDSQVVATYPGNCVSARIGGALCPLPPNDLQDSVRRISTHYRLTEVGSAETGMLDSDCLQILIHPTKQNFLPFTAFYAEFFSNSLYVGRLLRGTVDGVLVDKVNQFIHKRIQSVLPITPLVAVVHNHFQPFEFVAICLQTMLMRRSIGASTTIDNEHKEEQRLIKFQRLLAEEDDTDLRALYGSKIQQLEQSINSRPCQILDARELVPNQHAPIDFPVLQPAIAYASYITLTSDRTTLTSQSPPNPLQRMKDFFDYRLPCSDYQQFTTQDALSEPDPAPLPNVVAHTLADPVPPSTPPLAEQPIPFITLFCMSFCRPFCMLCDWLSSIWKYFTS